MIEFTAGLLAFLIARAAGVPLWNSHQAGDATDIGLCTAFLVWMLIERFAPAALATPLDREEARNAR